jgi:hypothetical protein
VAGALPLRKLPAGDILGLRLVLRGGGWHLALDRATAGNLSVLFRGLAGFLPDRGSPMAYHSTRFPGEMHFYAATLDHPETYQPDHHVHTAEMVPWLHLGDMPAQK